MVWFTYLLFPSSTFSVTLSDGLITLVIALAIYHRLRTGPEHLLPWWVIAPFFLWFSILVISALVNPHPWTTLGEVQTQFRLLLPFSLLPALFRLDLRRLLIFYLVFVGLMALFGLVQFIYGIDWFPWGNPRPVSQAYSIPGWGWVYRPAGPFATVIIYSSVMVMSVPLFFALVFSGDGKRTWLWAVGSALGALGVLISLTRGSWIALFFALALQLLRLPRRWTILILVLLTGVALLWGNFFFTENFKQYGLQTRNPFIKRAAQTTLQDNVRLVLWQSGWETFKNNPWFGVGIRNYYRSTPFRKEIVAQGSPELKRKMKAVFNLTHNNDYPVHNLFLQVLVFVGIIGFAVFLALWVSIFFWNFKWIRKGGKVFPFETSLLWGTSGGFVATLVEGIFQNGFFGANVGGTIMMYIGLSLYAGLRIRGGLAVT